MIITRGYGKENVAVIGEVIVLADGLEIEMDDRCVDVEIEEDNIYVIPTVEVELEVEIDTNEFDLEIC